MTFARKLAGLLVLLIAGSAGFAAHAAPFAYIGNSNGNNVSVIDLATNAVVATVPVGTFPYGVGVSPTGTRVFVGNNFSNNVSVINTASNTVIATVPVGPSPYGVAVNPSGTRAYVANGNGSSVSVIDTASNTVVATVGVGSGPFGVAVNPAGTRVYVVNRGNQFETPTVSVIDTATNTVVAIVTAPGNTPAGIALDPAGARAYVTYSQSNTVSVIDTATNTVAASVTVGTGPLGVAVNPAGTRVYVANNGSSSVSVIDTASNTVVATVAVGSMPYGVAVNPAGTRAYVGSFGGNNVPVIDTATNTMIAAVVAGNRPIAFGLFIGGPSTPNAPGAPVIGTASAGNGQATVSFSPPASDGGSPITSYTVTSSPGGITASGAASPITVTGLTNSTSYTFKVTATNAVGTGPLSAASNAVTPVGVVPIAYTFSGTSSGSLNGIPFTNAAVIVVATGNASAVTQIGGIYCNVVTNVTFNITGVGAGTVTDTLGIFANQSVTAVGLQRGLCTGSDWIDIYHAAFNTYALATAIGPVTGNPLTQGTVNTTAGPLAFSGTAIATFQAGAATAATLALTPSSLTFAPRTIATQSPAQTVVLANTGSVALNIGAITISGDFAFTSACGATLAPGATCTIDVTFTALTAGVRGGSLDVLSNAIGSPHSVSLSGTGQSAPMAVIEVTPSAVDFAPQGLGIESAVQIVSVANVGSATLFFGPISTTGDYARRPVPPAAPGAAPRPPTHDGECNIGLAAGTSCDLAVAFLPTAEGTRHGLLNIASNATPAPAAVRLVGIGFVSVPPRFLSVPESMLFAPQPVGTRSAGQVLTIANNSASAVAISELSVSGDFAVSDTCTTVPARGTCTLLVTFRPSAEGDRVGRITLRSLAETEPYEVSLAGAGVFNPVPALEISVARAGFGNSLIGTAPVLEASLVNIGEVPVALGAITTTGDFLVSHACGTTLAVGASCVVQVRFFPRMLGAQVGTIEVISNAAGSPHHVQFSGVGCSIPSVGRARLRPLLCAR